MEPDFGGYATKAGLKCSDGRVIKANAFAHMNGMKVPLVWSHGHSETENVLGHVLLEARPDGVYGYGFFNDTTKGVHAKTAVLHGDLDSLSIYANQLKEINKNVSHGNIREVSLVLAGANPGAKIDYVRIMHGADPDDYTELDDEALIHTGLEIDIPEDEADDEETNEDDEVAHADDAGETVKDVYDTLNEKQKNAVNYMIGAALDEAAGSKTDSMAQSEDDTDAAAQSDDNEGATAAHEEGSTDMTRRNVFEQNDDAPENESHTLSHDDMEGIFAQALKLGSLKDAVTQYAGKHLQHGVENIDILFPDAKNVTGLPELEKRRTEWVADVLQNTHKTPFSRIKTFAGDLTQDEARAKGYIKGNFKKEEWFGVTKRTTTPTTVYKKQKLDRDDILDITDFDIVTWLKAEMRLMTEEEIARAILIGDGRDLGDEDKVKDPQGASDGAGLRSILNDHELFVTTLTVNVDDANSSYEEVVDAVMDGMEFYKGTGTPTFYTTVRELNRFKKARDANGQRYYKNNADVAEALGVKKIVTVEPMQTQAPDVIGIIVNLDDYNTGTDRGGELSMFDDFDIDYNQYKYLMETRLSGALTKPKSALVVKKTAASNVLVAPTKPSFNPATGVITIPTKTGVVYKDVDGNTISSGAMTALTAGQSKTIFSVPASGYFFANTVEDSWPFKRPAA
jgi:hypothetical protein